MLLLKVTKCSQDNKVVIYAVGLRGAAAREKAKGLIKGKR
jgi:hypothetical protein